MDTKRAQLFFLFLLFFGETMHAQWTEKDSLWLQKVLSGDKEIQLNPEVIEAIKSGELINHFPEKVKDELKHAPRMLPITKDFQQYIEKTDDPGNLTKEIHYSKVPPGVFMIHGLGPVVSDELKSFSLAGIQNYQPAPPLAPLVNTDPLSNGKSGGVRIMVNINNLIDYYFIKKKWQE